MRTIAIISHYVKDMDATAAKIQARFPELSISEISAGEYRSIHVNAPDSFNEIYLVVTMLKADVDALSWSTGFEKGFEAAQEHMSTVSA